MSRDKMETIKTRHHRTSRCTALLLAAALVVLPGCQTQPLPQNDTETLTYAQRVEDINYLLDFMNDNYIFKGISPGAPDELFEPGSRKREKAVAQLVNVPDDRSFIYGMGNFFYALEDRSTHTTVRNTKQPDNKIIRKPGTPVLKKYTWEKIPYWESIVNNPQVMPADFWMKGMKFMVDSANAERANVVTRSNVVGIDRGDRLLSIDGKPSSSKPLDLAKETELKLQFMKPEGSRHTLNYTGAEMLRELDPPSPVGVLTQSYHGGSTQYIYIPRMNTEYMQEISHFFKSGENCKNIIIDVRGNGGGNSWVSDLIVASLWGDRPPITLSATGIAKDTPLTRGYYAGLNCKEVEVPPFQDQRFAQDELFAFQVVHPIPQVPGAFLNTPVQTTKPFAGSVYVLQDKSCYSSTSYLLHLLAESDLAISVGSTFYANYAAVQDPCIVLPNSGIPVSIETSVDVNASAEMPNLIGQTADYPVEMPTITAQQMAEFYRDNPDATDLLRSEYDAQLQKCLELIESAG